MIPLVVVVTAVALWPSVFALHGLWTDPDMTTFSHGYPVALAAIWFLWRTSQDSAWIPRTPRVSAAVLLGVAGLGWCVAQLAGIQVLALSLLVLIPWLAIAAVSGYRVARAHAFPFLLLLLVLPVANLTNGFFQWATVHAARGMLSLSGIPVFFEGNTVTIPEGVFEIAGGCSGLRYVLVGLTTAALIGEIRNEGLRRRCELLGLALVVTMFGNWVRVVAIILAGHYTHMQTSLIEDHFWLGWLLFGLAMAAFLWLERRLPARASASRAESSGVPRGTRQPWPRGALAATLSVLVAIVAVREMAMRPAQATLVRVEPPAGWQADSNLAPVWRPGFSGADRESMDRFSSAAGSQLDIYQAAYATQREGKEFRSSAGDPLAGIRGDPRSVFVADYRVGGRRFENPLVAQLYFGLLSVSRLRSAPSRVIVYHAACGTDCSTARKSIGDFIARNQAGFSS